MQNAQTVWRTTDTLLNKVRKEAEQNHRSLNNQIDVIIQSYFIEKEKLEATTSNI